MSPSGAVVLAAAYLMSLAYLTWSCFYGKMSPADPWHAKGLEWQTSSPPPKHNFLRTPIVTDEPYDYHDPETAPEPRARPVDAARARRVSPRPARETAMANGAIVSASLQTRCASRGANSRASARRRRSECGFF